MKALVLVKEAVYWSCYSVDVLSDIYVWFGSHALLLLAASCFVTRQAFWISLAHQTNCLDWTTASSWTMWKSF